MADSGADFAPPPPDPPLPAAWRWSGPLLAAGFAAALACRRLAYASGLRRPRRARLPVLSVGNLSAGGTGKTPAAAYLARGLLARGRRPAILMRGYGAPARGEPNDEARELARSLPGVPVLVNPDRCAGAAAALGAGADTVLLDDGFQHWRLARDLDLVLLDATAPWLKDRLLPWGRLREGAGALKRADVLILTRADLAPGAACAQAEELAARFPRALVCLARQRAGSWRPLFSRTGALPLPPAAAGAGPAPARLYAACGLGHPRAFFAFLERQGWELAGRRAFPDHYAYSIEDLRELRAAARAAGAGALAVTEKDAVKLEALNPPDEEPPVAALSLEFEVERGEEELWRRILGALERSGSD